jgi:hypothetical protein
VAGACWGVRLRSCVAGLTNHWEARTTPPP